MTYNANSFLNGIDVYMVTNFKTQKSIGKFCPMFPKNPERAFLGHPVQCTLYIVHIYLQSLRVFLAVTLKQNC